MSKQKEAIEYDMSRYRSQSARQGYKVPGAPYVIRQASSANSGGRSISTGGYAQGGAARGSGGNAVATQDGNLPSGRQNKSLNTQAPATRRLKTNRGIIKLWFFSLITLGIYGLVFISRLAKDLNIACEYDGKRTRGLIGLILLGIITFGVYSIVWQLSIISRIDYGANHYGVKSSTSITSYILWHTLGALILVGPIIANVKLWRTTNRVCQAYNSNMFGQE